MICSRRGASTSTAREGQGLSVPTRRWPHNFKRERLAHRHTRPRRRRRLLQPLLLLRPQLLLIEAYTSRHDQRDMYAVR